MSERINTSSEAIYFYCASIIWAEVKHVSSPGHRFPPGRIGVTRSALMSVEEESSDGGERSELEGRSRQQMRAFKMCFKLRCLTFNLNFHVCTCGCGTFRIV